MYIEASYWSSGDNAKLQLAVPRSPSYSCLSFYYHMYGSSMGTLNVFNGNDKIFTKSGNQGFYWKKVSRVLYLSDVLTFEGIRGSSYQSDIAIDDVTVLEGNCPGCGGVLNKSFGEVDISNSGDESESHCNWTIGSAGISQAVAIISLQRIYFGYCSEFVKIFDSQGVEVYSRRGCNSVTSGLTVEIPFSGGSSITLAASLSYRYSYVRVQYTILKQALSLAQLLPSWNLTVTNSTSSSSTVKWSQFPLTNLFIQRFLVNYREHNSNVSLIFEVPNSYDTHYTGAVLKSYQFYDVQVIAVTTSVGNGTYSTQTETTRTEEGVPSSEPSNVTLKNLKFDEVMVQWSPIPQHTAYGILLGYRVYLYEFNYWYYSLTNTVNTSSSSVHMVIFRGLKAAHSYGISVAAFTSKGAGPQSYRRYITTGCGGYINQSFGQIHVDRYRGSSYVRCNWEIGSVGISQAVAFVWIQDLYFYYSYEYLKILSGNGSVVLNQYGYSSAAQKTFLEVDFGSANNITVQVYLSYYYSHFKLQYGIMKQGIQSG
ncbi:MAM and fibronectin type III domain-containing protein 1-like [Orbicella faveolata]|uniref:MAM and fibronectin type III domain-containing protein 1-like n=1 Tax=Orbicella faveolata TaxID=48498 RepID=UPI0009E5C15A|nr:MAM and fibronectin type III domain-containing protein 1-like [Orbicella faveolata]